MNMFKRLWDTLFYTFASDEAYYKKYRIDDEVKGRVLAVVANEPRVRLVPTEKGVGILQDGQIIADYTRRSDAVRGIQRRGLVEAWY